MSEPSCRLYLITPPRIADLDRFAAELDAALAAADVAALQLRLKGPIDPDTGAIEPARDADVVRAANALIPIARARGVATLINDRPDLAVGVNADGVHIGQKDAAYADARRLVGRDRTVGVTCHASRDLAMTAAEKGADYVAFGAFYETSTKAAKTVATTELIEWWSEIFETPCVAIGGITAQNCGPIVRAGADFVAVSAGVWSYPGGAAAGVKAMNAAIAEARAPA